MVGDHLGRTGIMCRMAARGDGPAAVIVTGIYGAGKSSLTQEMATVLEAQAISYAIVDLDFLCWFYVPGGEEDPAVGLANTAAVVKTYRDAGVRHFLVAGAIRDEAELARVRAALAMPARVVRLVVDPDEIERRLAADVTTARRDDLTVAREWHRDAIGTGIEDLEVANDGSIRDLALGVVRWLGWLKP
jgi:hypothetical protein